MRVSENAHQPRARTRPSGLGGRSQQSFPEGCRAPLRGGGGQVRRPAGRRSVRHRRARTGRGGRGRQPRRSAPDALPGADNAGRPPWAARMSSGGPGDTYPPARGFRNTKTHLAPRKPRKRGDRYANRVKASERRSAAHPPASDGGCPASQDLALGARAHLPRKADASVRPRLAENLRPRELSFAQIVRSITKGIE